MSKRIGRLVVMHRTIFGNLHVLIHRNEWWRHRYTYGACWICSSVAEAMFDDIPEFQDQSTIPVSEPVYDADGNLLVHGVSMSATAKRQLDAIMAEDPEKADAILKAIDDIKNSAKPE